MLWVKGSGGDVGTIKLDGFATLYMAKLEALKGLYRGVEHEDEMVGYLPHCTFNLNPRAASIDTPLHAYVPRAHVDHMHADAIIAIAASKDSQALTREVFGDEIGWLPWKRPGYELGLWLERFCPREPGGRGAWCSRATGSSPGATTPRAATTTTIEVINRAIDWLERAGRGQAGVRRRRCTRRWRPGERRRVAAALMPAIRGMVSKDARMVGHFDDQAAVLEFVNARDMRAAGGARHQLPRPLPAHQDPAAGRRLRPGAPDLDGDARRAAGGGRGLPGGLRRPTTSAASGRTARRCATRTRSSTWCPGSA